MLMYLFNNSQDLRLDLTSTACYLGINSFLLDNAFYKCSYCFKHYSDSHRRLWGDRDNNVRMNDLICKKCFASGIQL